MENENLTPRDAGQASREDTTSTGACRKVQTLTSPHAPILDHRLLPPLPEELVEGVLYERGLLCVTGDGTGGLRSALIELALAVCEGGTWLSRTCRQGTVVLCNLDGRGSLFAHRLASMCEALGCDPAAVGERLRVLDLATTHLTATDMVSIHDALNGRQADLVVLDTSRDVHTSANTPPELGALFARNLMRFSRHVGAAVACVVGTPGHACQLDHAVVSVADACVELRVREDALPTDPGILGVRGTFVSKDFPTLPPVDLRFDGMCLRPSESPQDEGALGAELTQVRAERVQTVGKGTLGGPTTREGERVRQLEEALDAFMGERSCVERAEFMAGHPTFRSVRTINKYLDMSTRFARRSWSNSALIERVSP